MINIDKLQDSGKIVSKLCEDSTNIKFISRL